MGVTIALKDDTNGDVVFETVTETAKIAQDAYLRDAVEGDSNIIYVKGEKVYVPEQVTPSGAYWPQDIENGTRYNFNGGSNSLSFSIKQHTGYKLASGTRNESIIVTYTPGAKYAGTLFTRSGTAPNFSYSPYKYSLYVSRGSLSCSAAPGVIDDDVQTSITFTPNGGGGGGYIDVVKSSPANFKGKVLVPAKLQKEKTSTKKFSMWAYEKSAETHDTKTFLVKK